eukprot:g3418.t1
MGFNNSRETDIGIPEYDAFADRNLRRHFGRRGVVKQLMDSGLVEPDEQDEEALVVVEAPKQIFWSKPEALPDNMAGLRIEEWSKTVPRPSPGAEGKKGEEVASKRSKAARHRAHLQEAERLKKDFPEYAGEAHSLAPRTDFEDPVGGGGSAEDEDAEWKKWTEGGGEDGGGGEREEDGVYCPPCDDGERVGDAIFERLRQESQGADGDDDPAELAGRESRRRASLSFHQDMQDDEARQHAELMKMKEEAKKEAEGRCAVCNGFCAFPSKRWT